MNNETDTMYYIHKDYLGSYDVITDERGDVLERLSFDPWGRRRNPSDWTFDNVPSNHLFDRGYTGHEHLDVFSLINMNGRVYDPWLGRFLSPDPFVQAPSYSQSYNRYSYCFNNPLKFSDPSGYNAWKFEPADYIATFGMNCTLNGYQGYMGPGSGYHWSDGMNSYRDWKLMTTARFNNFYGEGAYDIACNLDANPGTRDNWRSGNININDVMANYPLWNSNGNNDNNIKFTGTNNFPGSVSFGLNGYGLWQMIAVATADGERYYTPYLDDEHLQVATIFLDNESEGEENLFFIAAEASATALLMSDHAIDQFIKANATARTYYTTLSGGTKYISKSKLIGFCEVAGKSAFAAGVIVNVTGAATGEQSWVKAGLNIGVEALPFFIGTGPGLAIGVIYYTVDYTVGWDGVMTPAENHPYIYYGPGGVPLPK